MDPRRPIFLNKKILDDFNERAEKIAAQWNYPRDQFFQIYIMVATIELGLTEKCFYLNGGIIYEGWNGYRHTAADRNDPNPYSAYNGFYRLEKHQMVGWSCYMIWRADNKEEQARLCNSVYGYWIEYEPEVRIWGWSSFQDYYTKEEAEAVLALHLGQKHLRRYSIEFNEYGYFWRIRLETTKKTNLRDCWKARIAK